jgi:hypothetical protein
LNWTWLEFVSRRIHTSNFFSLTNVSFVEAKIGNVLGEMLCSNSNLTKFGIYFEKKSPHFQYHPVHTSSIE